MIGILLIVAGAILTWAVHTHTSGVNLHTVGVILLVAGSVELFIELLIWARVRRSFRQTDRFFDGF